MDPRPEWKKWMDENPDVDRMTPNQRRNRLNRKWQIREHGSPGNYTRYLKLRKAAREFGSTLTDNQIRMAARSAAPPEEYKHLLHGNVNWDNGHTPAPCLKCRERHQPIAFSNPHLLSDGSLGVDHTPGPCIECCRKLVTPP